MVQGKEAQWPKVALGGGSMVIGASLGVLITPAIAIVGVPVGIGFLAAGAVGQARNRGRRAPLRERAFRTANRVLRCHKEGKKEPALTPHSPYGVANSAARELADAPRGRRFAIRHRLTKSLHAEVRDVVDDLKLAGYSDTTLAHYSVSRPAGDDIRDLAYRLAHIASQLSGSGAPAPDAPDHSPLTMDKFNEQREIVGRPAPLPLALRIEPAHLLPSASDAFIMRLRVANDDGPGTFVAMVRRGTAGIGGRHRQNDDFGGFPLRWE